MVGKIINKDKALATQQQRLFFALLLLGAASLSPAVAGPNGGQVVGGSGSIAQSGNTTTINQATQNMAIDWQSYNVNASERVQYIQPNSSSISLNRILSQSGSTIAGRIDANGQVILVNPNGIFFTPTSIINVGGIIASGLNIQPNDFMNGNYIFDEVLGTEGTVINSGMVNASLGGNVALIGKQVENDGLIVANLGTVNLAAGKQAVLTFDQGGLLGVRISKEILQEELGVDPAVLNSGEINAEGGRVLLTASTSQDVFSQAVNTGDLGQANSVVVHADGSFTLGSGADVINTGSIDASTTSSDQNLSQNMGRIVLIGENVTSSGELLANAANGNGGDIELHAQNTTLLTENSLTSARSESNGQGGMVKVLGDNVGLFDQATVDASGANGGGQVLIGGDQEGNNALIPNAEFIYLSEESQMFADALDNGDGGRLITFATDTARIYGDLFARGGINGGDGGFIETSGLRGFELTGAPDTSAVSGASGIWLIDPYSITINNNVTQNAPNVDDVFTSTGTPAEINVTDISDALNGGSSVIVRTGSGGNEAGDIIFDADLNYNFRENGTLTLDALNDIRFINNSRIYDSSPANNNLQDALTLNLYARGDVVIGSNVSITTQGGHFVVGDPDNNTPIIPTSFTNNGTINTTGAENRNGGNITITTSGALTTTGLTANGGMAGVGTAGQAAGSITLSGSITLNGDLSSVGSVGNENNTDGNGATITLDGPVVLANTATLDARGNTSGNIRFTNTLNGTTVGTENLTLYGNGMIFSGSVGDSIRLGSLIINATGNVNADTTITATSLDVQNSTRFTAGSIDTSGANDSSGGAVIITADTEITLAGLDTSAGARTSASGDGNGYAGGNVTLTGADITVSQITTAGNMAFDSATTSRDGGAGGRIQINGIEDTNNPPSITLNGDINASGGTGINGGTDGTTQIATLSLTSTTTATTTINYQNDFTSDITLTGSDGIDTLTSLGTDNTWVVTGNNEGGLNNRLTFTQMENLTGGTGTDDFSFTNTGTISGMIDGGGGSNSLTGRNTATTWNITPANTANSLIDTSGSTPETYVANVTNIDTLTGGNAVDTFTISANFSGTINGRGGADMFSIQADGITATVVGGTDSDTLTGFDSTNANTWTVTDSGDGILANGSGTNITFSAIENLTGGTGADDFTLTSTGAISGMIDGGGGSGTNTLTGRNAANTWNINGPNSLGLTNGATYVSSFINIDALTGGTGIDIFDITTTFNGDINGGNNNDTFELSASLSGTLNGGAGNDTFNINADNITATIMGGTDSDTLTGFDSTNANTWTVTDNGDGTLANGSGTNIIFSGIENITGGTGTDDFILTGTGAISGVIDGGSGTGINTLTGRDVDSSWAIGGTNSLSLTVNGTTYVNSFIGIDTLTGGTGIDIFTINTAFTGDINGGGNNDIFTIDADVNGTITGGAGDDRFDINAITNASLQGGADNDIFNLAANATNTINGNAGNNTFNIQADGLTATLVGGTPGTDTVTANDSTNRNDWNINNAGGGTLNSTITFSGIENLTGGTGTDDFTFSNTGAISGMLDGGGGSNSLTGRNTDTTWNIAPAANSLIDTSGSTPEIYVANVTRINTLIGGSAIDTFDITTGFTGDINGGGNNDIFTIDADVNGTITGGAGDDRFDINVVTSASLQGDADNDTFNLMASATGSIDGNAGNDTFNIQADGLTATLVGGTSGTGTDTITANDSTNLNDWNISDAGGGTLNNTITFSQMETLTGGTGTDNFLINNNGTITQINGGGGTNTLTARNNANEWDINANNAGTLYIDNNTDGFGSAYVNGFTNIQNLTGGTAADRFVMGSNGIISGTLDGGSTSSNTLISRQGVTNIWNFATDESGTLTQSGESTPYVNVFNNIQNYVGGGGSNEWADFSSASGSVDINAESYFGFTGIIGNGANSTLNGQDGQTNAWVINNVAATLPTGTAGVIDGINDGTFDNSNVTTATPLIFVDFANLVGGNANDTFTIVGTNRIASITGGRVGTGGTDSIQGPAGTGLVTWTLNSTGSTISYGTSSLINFTNIQTLSGAADTSDTFSFTTTPASTDVSTINGGNNSDTTTTDTVSVAGIIGGATLNIGTYQEIETYIGNASSTLEGGISSTWMIEDIGGATPGINDGRNAATNFYDFGTVRGGSGSDTFTFIGSATIASINGAGGTNQITGPDGTNTLTLTTATATTTLDINGTSTIINNIQTLNGGTGTDTFVTETTAAASGVQTLTGGAGNDIFVFSDMLPEATGMTFSGQTGIDTTDLSALAGPVTVSVNQYATERIIGNNSNSTFSGTTGTTTWNIQPVTLTAGSGTFTNGTNDGLISSGTTSQTFIDFNALTGGNGNDNFTIAADGNMTGQLSGGGGTDNTLTILNTAITIVETGTAGTPANLNVDSINSITGTGPTTLISDSTVNGNWVITGANTGTLNGMTFNNFAMLQGGTNSDTFTLHDSIDFAGSIDGGNTGTDEIIAGNRASNNWEITGTNNTGTVTGLTGNFSGIETLTGNNQTDNFRLLGTVNFAGSINGAGGTDQLTGGNSVNTWTITGTKAGNVTNLSNGFSAIETLVGGNQQDTFILSDTVTFGGTVSGGTQTNDQTDRLIAGDRENDWVITGANTGTVTGLTGTFTDIEFLDGNNQRDTLTLSDAHTFSGSFNGAGGSTDEVRGANATTNWTITGANNTGKVTGLTGTFTQVETLTGTDAQDTFTLLADTDFNGTIDGGAGSLNDTLVGGATSNSWVVDGTNGNTVTGLAAGNTFTNIQNLSGAAGAFDDTFTFRNGGSIAGHIDGGGQSTQDVVDMSALNSAITVRLGVGQDINNIERVIGNNTGTGSFGSTLVAEDNTNRWTITDFGTDATVDGINDGTVDGVQFINFNNLQGGTAADTFVVTASGDITGLIDGGSPNRTPWVPGQTTPAAVTEGTLQTEDILDYSALPAVDITIDTDFANIEWVKGNADSTTNTLRTGATGDNNWLILGSGTGVVNSTQFVDFNHIVGGDSNDTFVVEGDFGGSIRGGDGGGTDTVNYQALDTYRVVFGGALGIAEIERVEGGGSGFTIAGQAGVNNTWTINGVNQGDVTANGETLAFIGFYNIEGNDESDYTDTFTVQGGSMDGTVLGMAGDDVLVVELTGTETGQILFNGGSGKNTVRLQNGAAISAAYNGEYSTGIAGGYDRLRYTNMVASTPRVFTLDYQQVGEIQDTLSADSLTINGTSGNDTIELGYDAGPGMNTFTVNSPVVHYSNKDDLIVLGLAGASDTVNITADPAISSGSGVLTINAETVTSTSALTANQLVLDSVVNMGSPSTPVDINVANLSLLDTAGAASQALYLQAQNSLTLTGLGEVEIVDITVLDGDFRNSAALITSSQLNISTNGTMEGNIVLTGNNRLSGPVTLNAANDIVFDGDNNFSGLTDFTAANAISSEGANRVSAAISLNATTINLSGNNQITAPITLDGTNAIVNNTVVTDLGNITVENLTVTSTESISDSGVINVQAGGMGIADLISINGSIVLDNENNNFAEVRLNALNGAAIVNESDGITITNTIVGDALTVTSNIGLAANDIAIDNNMGLGSITAAEINLNANEGTIINQSSNLVADAITLTAASGIGENKTTDSIHRIDSTDSIRTTTPTLSVINLSAEGTTTTSGVINISNTGNVTINDLRNYGDIRLENAGNITLGITNNSGAIDAHYGGNISDPSYEGSVAIRSIGNNTFSTLGEGTLSGNADIIAENLFVNGFSRFGTQTSPVGLRVNDRFILPDSGGAVYYLGNRPRNIFTSRELLQLVIRGFVGISSQQLINIEALGEIDPAIFTEVRNYNYDDVAIRLPVGQRYDDEKENDEDEMKSDKEDGQTGLM